MMMKEMTMMEREKEREMNHKEGKRSKGEQKAEMPGRRDKHTQAHNR